MKKVNRGMLARRAAAGLLAAKCTGRYTDDFAFDAADNYGKMEHFLPVYLRAEFGEPEGFDALSREERESLWREHNDAEQVKAQGKLMFLPSDFKYKSGRAYEDGGRVRFYVLSSLSYDLIIFKDAAERDAFFAEKSVAAEPSAA